MTDKKQELSESRDTMAYDIVIVGAGPSGLAAAIRLKQLAHEKGHALSVCVLEKGSEPGAHIISGAIMDPRALDELLPDWQKKGAPPSIPVSQDCFLFLSQDKAFQVPDWLLPQSLKNAGNDLISLSRFVRWLAEQAEALGVDVFPGFSVTEILYSDTGAVKGVVTGAVGIGRHGEKTSAYQPGVEILASYTFFAEGARGQLGRQLTTQFSLDKGCDPQSYAISLKEIWQVRSEVHEPGLVIHSAGWPLDNATYGGAFLYHMPGNRIAVGLMVGLAYQNPYLSPYDEFQRLKAHPAIRHFLEGGERLEYGARAVAAGGLQALPDLVFPGGALLGCNAGFMNGARLKGIHMAIKSGMLAAEAAFGALTRGRCQDVLEDYPRLFRKSWMYEELYRARNFKPWISKGLLPGTLMFGFDQVVLRGKTPWTFHRNRPDYAGLKLASVCRPITYDVPDGVLQYDIPSSLYLSGTHHQEDQPSHLVLKDKTVPVRINLALYAGPESRYCPAAVYKFVGEADGKPHLQIHASNCLHCKACDIKDPTQNIIWVAPEGGDGPEYQDM
ncbi:MAG: electron transfer flavoprotein-ubiquinone oxidoreductase [Betaproteobacteria bacterium]|nr:electron transfer flavoprotein-ubiquinone oxidoreductase [Betaproteobacteria bacterium]